jgi:hypothetical protein
VLYLIRITLKEYTGFVNFVSMLITEYFPAFHTMLICKSVPLFTWHARHYEAALYQTYENECSPQCSLPFHWLCEFCLERLKCYNHSSAFCAVVTCYLECRRQCCDVVESSGLTSQLTKRILSLKNENSLSKIDFVRF